MTAIDHARVAVMNWKWMLIPLFLVGCTEMMEQPTREELDWNPPTLSKTGCPDLSGRYLAPKPGSITYDSVFPHGHGKELYPSAEIYRRDKDLNVLVTVESRPTGIYVQADNGRSRSESFAPYDGEDIGCHGDKVVSRFVGQLVRPGESGDCSHVGYGESRLSINSTGDLVVEFSQRTRCSTWGSLKNQKPKVITAKPEVFSRIR